MKNYFKLYTFLFFAALAFSGCRNPAYEMNVLFDANVIEYKATLVLKDATGAVLPNNLSVTIAGADAKSIYDFSGTKQIFAPGGVITLGVTPKDIPTAAKTLAFNVIIKGEGYDDKNIPVSIAVDQKSQVINVTMLKVSEPSPVTTVVSVNAPLVNGTTTTVTTVTTPASGSVAERNTITIPEGVQMRDAAGVVISGSSVKVDMVNFEAKDPATIALFPGASLSAPNVIGADGKVGSAFFIPAGFTSIKMFVNGKEVKKFSTPIDVNVELDPTFKPSATGQAVKVGDQLSVYSYEVETGQFKFETMGTASLNSRGKVSITFATDHLTIFVVGDAFSTTTCVDPKVTFIAPWLNDGTQAATLELLTADGSRVIATKTLLLLNGLVDRFKGLPAIAVKYRVRAYNGDLLAEGTIADPCLGAALDLNLTQPTTAVENITMVLNLVCAGKGNIIVPNFDIFYKPAGAPEAEYRLLGTANQGLVKTTLLKVGSSYDFKASWKNETKEVKNRTITAQDMSVIVGENDFLGNKSPNYNKSLLIKACKEL